MNLQEVIKNKKPIAVYFHNEFYDTFYYNEKDNIYQGQFGYINMDAITKIMLNKEEVNHLEIREHYGNNRH